VARLYSSGPSAEELALIGITAEDVGPLPDVEIWPENTRAVEVFVALSTQWRTGFSGATGLDYSVLPVVFDLHGLGKAKRQAVFPDLQIMERAALNIFNKG
jgi:hypothetical protein